MLCFDNFKITYWKLKSSQKGNFYCFCFSFPLKQTFLTTTSTWKYLLHLLSSNLRSWLQVYGLSWLVIVAAMLILKVSDETESIFVIRLFFQLGTNVTGNVFLVQIVSLGRKKFSADFQLMFRLLKLFLFFGLVATLVIMIKFLELTLADIFASFVAFLPTGWALLQLSQACRPLVKGLGMWVSVKALARGYEYLMGLVIFAPVAVLAWFPFVSEFQTRLLFNQAFSRGLQIQRILAGGKKHKW